MAAGLMLLSILIQLIAALLAFRLAIRARHIALLPLAIAILLMGVRRAYSFYSSIAFERSFDLGAETIALVISSLMLLGLVGLQRLQTLASSSLELEEEQATKRHRLSLANSAILLGVIAIAVASVVGGIAYATSRSTLLDSIFKRNMILADLVGENLTHSIDEQAGQNWSELANSLWLHVGKQYEGSYFCLMDSQGLLLAHTGGDDAVGTNVASRSFKSILAEGPKSLAEVIESKEDWVGYYSDITGQEQIVAAVHIPEPNLLALVHTPVAEIDAEIRASVLPLTVGLAITIFLLLPISLAMLYWAYSVSVNELLRRKSQLRQTLKFERTLRNELDHRVRNNLASLISLLHVERSSKASPKQLLASTRDRIGAMAVVHSTLSEGKWQCVALADLIMKIVGTDRMKSVVLEGPTVKLPISQTQAMGMVINELSTNCAKYGSMTVEDGRVLIKWDVQELDEKTIKLSLSWHEQNGPSVDPNSECGSGLDLVAGFVKFELGGEVEFGFEPSGVRHRFCIPLSSTNSTQLNPVS